MSYDIIRTIKYHQLLYQCPLNMWQCTPPKNNMTGQAFHTQGQCIYLRRFKRLELIERVPRDWNNDIMTLVWYRRLLNISARPKVDDSGLRFPAKKGSTIKITPTVAPRYLRRKSWIMPNHQFSWRTTFKCFTRAWNLCMMCDASLFSPP